MDSDGHQRVTSRTYGLAYAMALPSLCDVARSHGYALAVHGSMATDLDLVAIPWVEGACQADDLAEALRVSVGGMFATGDQCAASEACVKLHGRRVYTILPSDLFLGIPRLPFVPWIDLSVMPLTEAANDHA
jgi:hypothetical protein